MGLIETHTTIAAASVNENATSSHPCGDPPNLFAPQGKLMRALNVTITGGKIVQIDVVADPARLRQLDLAVLND